MKKGGLADSPFFSQPTAASVPHEEMRNQEDTSSSGKRSRKVREPRRHDTVTPSNRDTTVSRNHDAMVETVRKAVREIGKEAATHRFTAEEKRAVLDIIYSYKGSGIKTSENEVARIAVNYILEDYKQNGRNSILDRILKALNE